MHLSQIIPSLTGAVRFTRSSPSWSRDGQAVARANEPHLEETDAGPAVFLGRHTRNLLAAEFAPLKSIPADWANVAGLVLQEGGRLLVQAHRRPAILTLPALPLNPHDELVEDGSSYVGVLYQLSLFARGQGTLTLRLRDAKHDLAVERKFALNECVQRVCLALDGPLENRLLEATLALEGGAATLQGLMLEPFVTTHRTCDRAALFPCPGGWVPGGQARAGDRLEVRLPLGSIPRSGMIDFWVKPAWEAAHPNHVFFEMAHWYFGFAAETQAPLFHAGEKPCPWMYYWEWCTGQGFQANTWHHYAVVWDEDGPATIYLDGQSRACVQQVKAHALDPARVGETLVIGGPLGEGMLADPNVAGELDGFLKSFRLTAGRIAAENVLVAMETTDPRQPPRAAPDKAVFLLEGHRKLVATGEDYCWFPQRLQKVGSQLELSYSVSDDHHPGRHLRPRPGKAVAVSDDQGRTWQRTMTLATAVSFGVLPDGRVCYLIPSSYTDDNRPPFQLRLVDSQGNEERFPTTIDMAGFNGGRMPYCPNWLLPLQDGTYLLFEYSQWPGESKSSVTVLASHDLRHWRAIAAPLRAETGRQESYSETAAVQFPNGRMMTITRTGGWNQALVKCFSDDNGRTWTAPLPSGLCGVDPKVHLAGDGTLFLATGRPGIVLAVSHDCGESFETCACAEDDRVHEMVDFFGWYGYSTMNNGLFVDEQTRQAYLSYDLLGVRLPPDATSRNACYVCQYPYRIIENYRAAVQSFVAPDDPRVRRDGHWQVAAGRLAVTTQTGALLTGEFKGSSLVALIETSPHAGVALVQIDDGPERRFPLYFPQRRIQRRLIAHDLGAGVHRFRIALEAGNDPEHKFANPEMPMSGGPQTAFLAGVTNSRRLVIHGLEILG